jgi:hypothetical protein
VPAPSSAPPSSPAASVSPSPAGSPASAPVGGTPVAIAPGAAGQAGAEPAARLLASYFAAINRHDYHRYISLFDSQAQPDHTLQSFRSGYRSTTDSDMTLAGLAPMAAGLAATVTFVSHQDRAASATDTTCTRWRITLYLESDGPTFLIGLPPPGYQASDAPC